MSDVKAPQKGSVLSNLETSTEALSPPPTPPNQGRSASPEEKMQLADSKDIADVSVTAKEVEPEAKKRKRSQRACIRCRGQKLKCDGVFPCARCLKLKLVCKEPSEANAGTPTSNRVNNDDRDSKANTGSYASSVSTRPHSQSSVQLTVSGLPSHANGPPHYGSSSLEAPLADRSRGSNHMHAVNHSRGLLNHHPSDRFGYSLPDAVRRIDALERTVSRLVERVEGQPASFDRVLPTSMVRPSSAKSTASPSKPERKRARADSPDDSDAEVDELQDGVSEASVPLQALSQQDRRSSRDVFSAAEERSAPTRASNDAVASIASSSAATLPPSARPHSNGGRHAPAHNPIEAGFITPEMGQMLLEVFLTYCHVFAPFVDLDDKASVASLASSEPFLLSVLLTIGSLYQDSHGKGDPSVRSEIHAGLASDRKSVV